MRMDKYLHYQYQIEVEKILSSTKLSILDKTQIHIIKENCYDSSFYYIIEDLYKLMKNNISTSQLSVIYGTGTRNVQLWLKDMGLSRSIKESRNLTKGNKINIVNTSVEFDDDLMKNKNYCLYRFLDKNRHVLYIGKCEKSIQSNGRGGKREYFIKDRLWQHYSPSSKQLPKSLYLNTKYIEVAFPRVENNKELGILESKLISYYEREKLQCNYNMDLMVGLDYVENDNMSWLLYEEKTERDIKILLKRYNYDKVPSIEIINERLKSILWFKNKLNK